ncbi:MAG: HAD family phosphatase [Candidatus Marinimicrobia bacterium]|nr:HAD family phosphatase [Candidatus Neomarinimicrobiota bacterium]
MLDIKFLSPNAKVEDFTLLEKCSDGNFTVGKNSVNAIYQTKDKKVEFIYFDDHILAYVNSAMGYPAYYPIRPTRLEKPVQAVLMDLDGTSVKSEEFWIWMIEQTTASLLNNKNFQLEESDIPYVSGHSVSEHLEYCIRKYCPDKTVEEARQFYFMHTRREMNAIVEGHGRKNAFVPTEGLKAFLLELKAMKIKIGLVTSGLYEKAWPEILSAFQTLKMGDPKDFYDAVVTAGFPIKAGHPGTLGELSPKPHPWLYSETARVGLGIPREMSHRVIGIEDSGAGICSIRLAGFSAIGIAEGNIVESGVQGLCAGYCRSLEEVLKYLK